MRRISALVNARLDSSRVEQKMTRSFAGTTLIEIALEKLNVLNYFDNRFFAVAEEELERFAVEYENVEILKRKPEAVAKGPHPPMVTFEHYTRVPTKYIFVINACHAFLSLGTINKAYEIFQETNHRSYLAVMPTREWIFTGEGVALTHKDPNALQNTSDGQHHYKATQAFYIIDKDYFIETKGRLWTLTPNDPFLIEMPPEEAIDVDTEDEFVFSSFLYGKLMNKNS